MSPGDPGSPIRSYQEPVSTVRRHEQFADKIAFILLVTDRDRGSILVSHRYTLKTSNIGIILLGLTKLLTALTAIYNIISLLMYLSFNLS